MDDKFDLSDTASEDTLTEILDVSVDVLRDYCGEGSTRIVRMARWLVGNLGAQNYGGSVSVGVSRPDGDGLRRVMVYVSDDLTPDQTREAAAAMLLCADKAESVH